jgi:hypothetical protein
MTTFKRERDKVVVGDAHCYGGWSGGLCLRLVSENLAGLSVRICRRLLFLPGGGKLDYLEAVVLEHAAAAGTVGVLLLEISKDTAPAVVMRTGKNYCFLGTR